MLGVLKERALLAYVPYTRHATLTGIGSALLVCTAGDPAAALGVLTTLAVTATLASYLPARRAARVDPMRALRVE